MLSALGACLTNGDSKEVQGTDWQEGKEMWLGSMKVMFSLEKKKKSGLRIS